MAISKDKWDKAKILFETGKLSLSQISRETGIDKSSIGKKAKIQQWKSGEEADYIDAKVLIAQKNSTLPIEKIHTLDDIANNIIISKNLVYRASHKIINKTIEILDAGVVEDRKLNPRDLKDLADTVDKASLTLNVNQRHSNSNIQVVNQNSNENKKVQIDWE